MPLILRVSQAQDLVVSDTAAVDKQETFLLTSTVRFSKQFKRPIRQEASRAVEILGTVLNGCLPHAGSVELLLSSSTDS